MLDTILILNFFCIYVKAVYFRHKTRGYCGKYIINYYFDFIKFLQSSRNTFIRLLFNTVFIVPKVGIILGSNNIII